MIEKFSRVLFASVTAAVGLCGAPVGAQVCTFNTGPDVIVGDLTGPSNYVASGGVEALSLGTTSCNLGNARLRWFASSNQHPVIGGNLYRLKDYGSWTAIEQVGMSWLKHGFFALDQNLCCSNCTDESGDYLGVGCSDPYTSGRNGTQGNLGPRRQVNATTGGFTYPPANPSWGGSVARRLQVAVADLEPTATTPTRYFGEAHYVSPDDAAAGNQDNNASTREVTVSGSGSAWTFGFLGATQREVPAILVWQQTDPTVDVAEIQLDGRLILAHKVTDLGGGTWHYEFALYNMNSDDSIRSFSVPTGFGVNLTNIGFHDVGYHSGDGPGDVDYDGTDWSVDTTGGAITWSTDTFAANASANALRWGSTYNFRFDADAPPQGTSITLGRYKSATDHVEAGLWGPSGSSEAGVAYCNGAELALCPCAPGGADSGCDNAQGTGGVELAATAFAPDGLGGGTATFESTGYPAGTTPSTTLIRASTRESPPVPFGDGLRCIGVGDLVRVTAGFASGGASTLNVNHGAGAGTFDYQVWYRNNPATYCDPAAAYNLSNGYELVW